MKHPTILVDCDGVLTDGRLNVDHTGQKMFKSFHTRDVRAIRELIYHGYEVVIVSADDWPGITYFAEKVGALIHITRDKSKLTMTPYIAVGDDAWDVSMLLRSHRAFAPADCDASVREIPGIRILPVKGGQGVIAELLRVLAAENKLSYATTPTPADRSDFPVNGGGNAPPAFHRNPPLCLDDLTAGGRDV